MFKNSEIKWGNFFILYLVFTIIGLLPKLDHIRFIQFDEIVGYLFYMLCTVFSCWFVHYYFVRHDFRVLGNKRKGFVSNVLGTAAALLVDFIFSRFVTKPTLIDVLGFSTTQFTLINLSRAFFVSVLIFIIVYNVHINNTLQKSILENGLLKQAQLRAQILSLQQQISPHFLFNSLSTLKTMAKETPTKTYVIQLANAYRYLLNFSEHHLASLKDELAFMKSYLHILKERYEDGLQVSIEVPAGFLAYQIPPLSLQLLVENAIKHNVISPARPLCIKIHASEPQSIVVENNYQARLSVEESTGKGLQNIKDRYRLLANQSIEIYQDETIFKVTLPLLLS
jgi:two-component system LytT family sensor kinase